MAERLRVIAEGLKMAVVGTAFLLAVDGALRVESMSSTTRSEPSGASACATSSRFTAIRPSKFSPLASISVSKPCSVEVKAAPRSQFLFEPIKRKVGSADTRTASLRSS